MIYQPLSKMNSCSFFRRILTCVILLVPAVSFPCNLSSLNLVSVVSLGGSHTITMELCIGYGVTGVVRGGDGDTFDMVFSIHGPGGGPVNITSFSPNDLPPFLQSTFTGCEMPGYDVGPLGAPFNCQASIYYAFDPLAFPACANGFTCVSTTALCGNVAQQCITFTMVLDALPDSIRVWGVEGAGNPNAGCTMNPDMLITFTILPVIWGDQSVKQVQGGNKVKWTTLVETASDYFEVYKSADGFLFDKVATLPSKGNGNSERRYEWLDDRPQFGSNFYKIRQVDVTGDAQESNVLQSEYVPPSGLHWVARPGTTSEGQWNATFLSDKEDVCELEVISAIGRTCQRMPYAIKSGLNDLSLPTAGWAQGIYIVNLKGKSGMLQHRFVKI